MSILGEAACAYGPDYPRPGWAEQAPALWEDVLAPTIARALDAAGVAAGVVRALGVADSRLWAEIRADCSGLPVEIPVTADTSPVGAAVCAAVAGGVQDDLAACAGLVGAVAETIDPDPANRTAYDDAYGAYGRLFNSLGPMFR